MKPLYPISILQVNDPLTQAPRPKKGFTLIEVVLAIGVIGIAVVSLVMMFGPTMKSVRQVISTNEAIAASDAFNDFLQDQARGIKNAAMTDNFKPASKPLFDKDSVWLKNPDPAIPVEPTDTNNFYVFTTQKGIGDSSDGSVTKRIRITNNEDEIKGDSGFLKAQDKDEHLVGGVLCFSLFKMTDPSDTTGKTLHPVYTNIATEAYLPIVVKVYSVDAGNPSSSTTNRLEILSYNTAVLR